MSTDTAARDGERTFAAFRKIMIAEVSSALADSFRLLGARRGSTQELRFRSWPELNSVTVAAMQPADHGAMGGSA
ncbi:hypothetical protein [Nocardia rhamnosiphila]